MLFHTSWTRRDSGAGENSDRRALAIQEKFEVPEGVTVHSWTQRVDGTGGFALIEMHDANALAASVLTFSPFFKFEIVPVIQHEQWMTAMATAISFREGVS